MGGGTRVLIADAHRLVRQSLGMILQAETDIEVVGEAEDGDAAVRMAKALSPEAVRIDVTIPRIGDIEATERIVRDCPGVRVIGRSVHTERFYVDQMFRTGACGYVLKGEGEEVLQALPACQEGRIHLSSRLNKE